MSPEEYHAIWLCCAVTDNGVKRRLLDTFKTPSAIYEAPKDELQNAASLEADTAERLAATRTPEFCERLITRMERDAIRFLWHTDAEFPKCLRMIMDAPLGLFVQGRLPGPAGGISVAIVGTRQSSPYGEFVAKQFGHGFADAGIPVVSGLARGIDAAAHQGCLDGGGFPVAVLGSGIGAAYPRNNTLLFRNVIDRGCVISEYGPGVPALAHHFPHRNRLIAGLSSGVVVVEAQAKSGTLITVDRALEQGKSVYVVPGRVTDRNSIGCNQLIREGAQLVTNPGEVMADLASQTGMPIYTECEDGSMKLLTRDGEESILREPCDKNTKKPLASNEKIVYAFLRLSPKHFDQLIWESGLTPSELTNVLYSLERAGMIERISPGCFSVKDTGL
ncbi:MAG: DNA-processing protein DprA [Lachnospiraceae bacterium]|nr:DNA-processing protein DprA [Lachnospiraceae bacterium]